MSVSDFSIVVASLSLMFGLFQYRKAQRWKRAEWIAEQIKQFRLQPGVCIALRLIEWEARALPLFPTEGAEKQGMVYVTSTMVQDALNPDNEDNSEVDIAIRDAFNDLLEALERFENFIQSGLVSVNELKPYLKYHLDMLGDQPSEKIWRETFWKYVNNYFLDDVPRFFKRFGYEVPRA